MIEIMPESAGNVLGMAIEGTLTDADYKNIIVPQLEARLVKNHVLRLLILTKESFAGWNLRAMWDDFKLGLQHRNDFEKIAIVGATGWLDMAARLAACLMKGETRMFARDQLDEAWEWIRA